MKRILYAGGEIVTNDAMADALMEYASVLAIVNSADVVTVPGLDAGGTVRDFALIIGPASQILSMGSDGVSVRLNTDEAVDDLQLRARRRLPDVLEIADPGISAPAETDAESTTHEDDAHGS